MQTGCKSQANRCTVAVAVAVAIQKKIQNLALPLARKARALVIDRNNRQQSPGTNQQSSALRPDIRNDSTLPASGTEAKGGRSLKCSGQTRLGRKSKFFKWWIA